MMSRLVRSLLVLSLLIGAWGIFLSSTTQTQAAPNEPHPLRAELLADVTSITPVDTGVMSSTDNSFTLGVLMSLQPGWHTYWVNPGDSGSAPEIQWQLPEGFEVGQLQWPLPIKFSKEGDPAGYGYKDSVFLTAKVHIAANVKLQGQVTLGAKVRWLVCNEEKCLPGEKVVSLNLMVSPRKKTAEANIEKYFQPTLGNLPVDCEVRGPSLNGADLQQFHFSPQGESDLREVNLTWKSAGAGKDGKPAHYTADARWKKNPAGWEWFPGSDAGFEIQNIVIGKNEIEFDVARFTGIATKATSLRSLLVYRDAAGVRHGVWIDVPVKR